MNKKVSLTLKIIAAILAILLPLALVFGLTLLVVPQYSNTFVGALDDKFDRLNSIDEPKIVVVGGSSVAFGLDSEKMEEYTGMPCVNFGLYAALGTKVMLDLSRSNINEGDVVVIAPEINKQTMSMYFSTETTLQAIDDDYSLLRYIDINNIFSLLGGMFKHVGNKIEYAKNGAPNPDGVYNSKSFDEYGDVVYERPENTMELYYDPNTVITLDGSILDAEFMEYLNDYISFCKRRGATVCFSFCPMNSLALAEGTTDESIAEFEELLIESLDCNVISYIDDYILDPGYFYDTNFHLNDTGVKYRTITLAKDILLEIGEPKLITDVCPEPPALASGLIVLEGYDENEKYFTYELLETGNYMVTGLTELGKSAERLTLPVGVRIGETDSQIAITAIAKNAFSDSALKELTITESSELRQFMNGAFLGASKLSRINLYIKNAEDILPPASFEGTANNFELHVPDNSSYKTDYFWSEMKNLKIVADLVP